MGGRFITDVIVPKIGTADTRQTLKTIQRACEMGGLNHTASKHLTYAASTSLIKNHNHSWLKIIIIIISWFLILRLPAGEGGGIHIPSIVHIDIDIVAGIANKIITTTTTTILIHSKTSDGHIFCSPCSPSTTTAILMTATTTMMVRVIKQQQKRQQQQQQHDSFHQHDDMILVSVVMMMVVVMAMVKATSWRVSQL